MQITIFPLFIEGGVLLREKKIHQKKISQAIHAHTHNGMAQWKQFSETYLFFDIVRKNKLIICSKLWLEFMTTDRNASYKISIYASKFQVVNIWEFENTKLEQHEVIFFWVVAKIPTFVPLSEQDAKPYYFVHEWKGEKNVEALFASDFYYFYAIFSCTKQITLLWRRRVMHKKCR